MHPDMLKLMGLQALDLEAKRLRDEVAALPGQVGALEQKSKAVAGQRAVVLDLLAQEETLRRRQESDIADLKTKAVRARQKLDAATSAAQVTALEHELAFGNKEVLRLEDLELESMERSEALETQKTIADKVVAEAEAAFTRMREQAVGILDKNNAALADVDPRRGAQRATISEATLSVYDRISRTRGSGIAEALEGKCTSCQMMLRPQRWNDLRDRDNEDMVTCESCARLLYYDPARDAPQRKPQQGAAPDRKESIAAQIVRGL